MIFIFNYFISFFLFSFSFFLNPKQYVLSDTLYSEGFYDYSSIPGGAENNDTQPNVPFIVNTNRNSDGISSTSAFTSSSPRFPYYEGSEANYSDRYVHYTKYKESAAEQGISIVGAGDADREAARLKITSKANYESLPAPNKTFTVYAAIKWNPSDFAIQEGEYYRVEVLGNQTGYSTQFWYDGGIRVNAEGYSSYFDSISNCHVGMGRCRPHLKKRRRLQSANWMSLACAIGEFVRPLTEIKEGEEKDYHWIPLDESALTETIFNVGQSVDFRAVYTGQLICFANDAHALYWNNHGNLQVTVVRTSWPPSNSTYYKPLRLPACDSAQVVYQNHGNNDPSTAAVQCNADGGGGGWSLASVLNTAGGTYGSGAPSSYFSDLPGKSLE